LTRRLLLRRRGGGCCISGWNGLLRRPGLLLRHRYQRLVDLDRGGRADSHTGHTEYAVRLSCWVRFVGVSCAFVLPILSRVLEPFKDSDRAYRKASSVCDAVIPVNGDEGPVHPERLKALPCLGVRGLDILVCRGCSLLARAPGNVFLVFSNGLQALVELIVYWHGITSDGASPKCVMDDCSET
jgi:hypothetical protein